MRRFETFLHSLFRGDDGAGRLQSVRLWFKRFDITRVRHPLLDPRARAFSANVHDFAQMLGAEPNFWIESFACEPYIAISGAPLQER